MHDAAFAAAARPARIAILGLPMRDYSLGHELLLVQSANPLLSNAVFFDSLPVHEKNQAVISAALICCNTWKQNQRPHRWLRLWYFFQVSGADFKREAEKFRAYRKAGATEPPVPTKEADIMANGRPEADGRHLGGPLIARLLNFASRFPENELRVHGESIFDYPLGLCIWRYVCELETRDAIRIENAKEFQYRTEMEGHRSDWEKENPGKEAIRPHF